jgi:hypothetical protein
MHHRLFYIKNECAVGDARGSQIVQIPNSQAELTVFKTVEFVLPLGTHVQIKVQTTHTL